MSDKDMRYIPQLQLALPKIPIPFAKRAINNYTERGIESGSSNYFMYKYA